jgi:TetR/AcrR family transcriptional repressor of bet genes
MGRPSNREQRRVEILEAMVVVVARAGYERASIAEIAKEAGLTAGLLHYHFESKQEMLLALAAHLESALWARYRALSQARPEDRLGAFVDAHLALGPGSDPTAAACWAAITAEAVHLEEVRAVVQRTTKAAIAELEELLAAEGKDPALAPAIYAAISGALLLSRAAPGAIRAGTAAGIIGELAAASRGPKDAPPRRRRR